MAKTAQVSEKSTLISDLAIVAVVALVVLAVITAIIYGRGFSANVGKADANVVVTPGDLRR